MKQELSTRLKTVASYVKAQSKVADIGCDHAYLPIYLIQKNKAGQVIGSEIAQGPLENGRSNVLRYGLQDKIELRYGGGLDTIEKEDGIDTVTIAGMGGKTIVSILADAFERGVLPVNQLVLQPNTDEWFVRFWLWQHGYQITDETILDEKNNTYEVIVAEYIGKIVTYTREDILFGPYLRQNKNAIFCQKYKRELEGLKRIINHIPKHSARYHYVKNHLESIEVMLNE